MEPHRLVVPPDLVPAAELEMVLREQFGDEWGRVRDLLPRCVECGDRFMPRRSDALFCSPRCRQRGHRRRRYEPGPAEARRVPLAAVHPSAVVAEPFASRSA